MAIQSFDLLLSKTLQEIASSVHFLLNVSLVTLQCHPSHKTICLRATRKLGWKARQTWLENISRRKLYSRKGLICLKAQNGGTPIFRIIFTVENCSQFRFHFPAIIFITFNNQAIVDSKANFVAWKVRCILFPKRVLFKLYSFPLN